MTEPGSPNNWSNGKSAAARAFRIAIATPSLAAAKLFALAGWYGKLPTSTRWAVPFAFVIGLAVGPIGKKLAERRALAIDASPAPSKPLPVATQDVSLHTIMHQFFTHSFLQPKKEIMLRPNNNVTVRQVMVEVGQQVKRGEVLAYTDSEAQALRAELDGIDLQMKNLDYSVTVALAKKSFISSKEFQTKELEHKASRLRGRLAQIETTGAIHSPINGIVSEISLKSGDYIDNPSQYYIKIADSSSFRLQLYLPQTVAARLTKGASALLTRSKTDEYGKESVEVAFGKIAAVAPVVDPKSGSVLTDVDVATVPKGWISGQHVQVTMTIDQAIQVVAVPNEAIVYENNHPFVYRVSTIDDKSGDQGAEVRAPAASDEAPRAIKEAVVTGLRDAKFTEIKEGIEELDKVVIEGQGGLANNAPIELVR